VASASYASLSKTFSNLCSFQHRNTFLTKLRSKVNGNYHNLQRRWSVSLKFPRASEEWLRCVGQCVWLHCGAGAAAVGRQAAKTDFLHSGYECRPCCEAVKPLTDYWKPIMQFCKIDPENKLSWPCNYYQVTCSKSHKYAEQYYTLSNRHVPLLHVILSILHSYNINSRYKYNLNWKYYYILVHLY